MELNLPRSTAALVAKVATAARNPGLQLDKYSTAGEQTQQKACLARVCEAAGDKQLLAALGQRREMTLNSLPGVEQFACRTAGPLTLHLSRAASLENAGICLHPLYGFVYLPGTGLKGMARAYAETVAGATTEEVDAVFGNQPGEPKKEKQHAGAVVFHDAWPAEWPRLVVDIVNNHHADYYQARPTDNAHPAGDWEDPIPVYFLAVPRATTFRFALSLRRAAGQQELLKRAREWLVGSLCHLGAGAKTAAGYGSFWPLESPPPPLPLLTRSDFGATLELATPAFLAGANQRAEDCDLRSATLRGLLRWWWRTMHAGYVDVAALRRMEAALWGDTAAGGAIRIELRLEGKSTPVAYDKQAEARQNGLPRTPDRKTTQGLWYHSYGMNDGGKQRHYLKAGSKWRLVLTARDAPFSLLDGKGKPIRTTQRTVPRQLVLDQALAALWWLCALGGVGSKERKGFGNFKTPPELDPFYGARFVSKGKELRAACGLSEDGFRPDRAGGPALRQMVDLGRKVRPDGNGWLEIPVGAPNVWRALDAVGMAAQKFAQARKHQREKQGLGLPRRIGHPARGQFRAGPEVGDRHASPMYYHLHPEGNGFILRVAAFPAARLPNLQASEALLEELLRYFAAMHTL